MNYSNAIKLSSGTPYNLLFVGYHKCKVLKKQAKIKVIITEVKKKDVQ